MARPIPETQRTLLDAVGGRAPARARIRMPVGATDRRDRARRAGATAVEKRASRAAPLTTWHRLHARHPGTRGWVADGADRRVASGVGRRRRCAGRVRAARARHDRHGHEHPARQHPRMRSPSRCGGRAPAEPDPPSTPDGRPGRSRIDEARPRTRHGPHRPRGRAERARPTTSASPSHASRRASSHTVRRVGSRNTRTLAPSSSAPKAARSDSAR